MQAINFASFTSQTFFVEEKENLHQNQSQIDFQSKMMEDLEIILDKETKNQKKFNFNPALWTNEDEKKLIELHKRIGNKWTSLSKHFAGSCQNSIKNRFYSRLRKSIRKLNKSLPALFGKKYNKFNLNVIFKLSNVSEGKVIGKCTVETQISTFYKDFIYKLIEFSQTEEQHVQTDRIDIIQEVQNFTLSLIALENLFRIVSGERVYKGKKKNIAYLKRFNFKLDTESKKTLVISRQNCYITDGPIDLDSYTEKSLESIFSFQGSEKSPSMDSESNKMNAEKIITQKTDEKTINFEQCQKNFSNDSLSYTTDGSFPQSPYQSLFLDEELREYEMFYGCEKGKWCQNLLDQYSGTKFNFDIEC